MTRAILEQNRHDRFGQPLRLEDFEDLKLLFEPEVHSRNQSLDWRVAVTVCALDGQLATPVRQVTLNLLLNAGVAAGPGGMVGLTVAKGDRGIAILVSNTGAAMSKGDLVRLLASDPLPLGGGVGLRLVHDIVAGLGGTLLHERVDAQTRIRVDLPPRGATHA